MRSALSLPPTADTIHIASSCGDTHYIRNRRHNNAEPDLEVGDTVGKMRKMRMMHLKWVLDGDGDGSTQQPLARCFHLFEAPILEEQEIPPLTSFKPGQSVFAWTGLSSPMVRKESAWLRVEVVDTKEKSVVDEPIEPCKTQECASCDQSYTCTARGKEQVICLVPTLGECDFPTQQLRHTLPKGVYSIDTGQQFEALKALLYLQLVTFLPADIVRQVMRVLIARALRLPVEDRNVYDWLEEPVLLE